LNNHWEREHPADDIPDSIKINKRGRTDEDGNSVKKQKTPPLTDVLSVLEKYQLINMLCKISELPGSVPTSGKSEDETETTFRELIVSMIPGPNMEGISSELSSLADKVIRGLPYAKYGSNRDDYAWKRVSPLVTAFKDRFYELQHSFHAAKNYENNLIFVRAALKAIDRLPVWENDKKNKPSNDMTKACEKMLVEALKNSRSSAATLEKILNSIQYNSELKSSRDLAIKQLQAVAPDSQVLKSITEKSDKDEA